MYRITPMYPEDPRAPFYNPGAASVPPMARLYLTREKLISRQVSNYQITKVTLQSGGNDCAAFKYFIAKPTSVNYVTLKLHM